MKTKPILLTTVFILTGLCLSAQIIFIPIDNQNLGIHKETVDQQAQKTKQPADASTNGVPVSTYEKQVPPCIEVKRMIKEFRLDQEPEANPHLAFTVGDESFFCEQKMSRKRYRLEFAARRIILDEADKQGVIIKDAGTLAWAAGQVMSELLKARVAQN